MALNTTAATATGGQVVSATFWNTEIRDAVNGIQSAWTTYTPTWSSSGTQPTLGNGSATGRYMRVGKTLHYVIVVGVGSTSTVGTGSYVWSLPFTVATPGRAAGYGGMFDASAAVDLTRVAIFVSSTTVGLSDAVGVRVGAAAPVVPANGDFFSIAGTLELT